MGLLERIKLCWLSQRGYLFPWVSVAIAVGIGVFFSLRYEPQASVYISIFLMSVFAVWIAVTGPNAFAPLILGLIFVATGFCLAGARAHLVAEPVLGWRYYGPIEGRLVALDRSASDALRLTLDHVRLLKVPQDRTPERVRVSLHGNWDTFVPQAGLRVMLTGHLSPPSGPIEPHGFDFQRHAWFQKIGAIGYTRTPVLSITPPDGGLPLMSARLALSKRIQAHLRGEVGAFAAAVVTGDRSAISQATMEDLRHSNLAHLLAISGLHMGLLVGFVFAVARLGFAMVPAVGMRIPAKKLSAGIALTAAAGYLALSGGNVATERAFVMAAVALVAVMLDRRVISLRAVAVAAIIVLTLRPEALLGPGFQMSFAATTGLVAAFGLIRELELSLGPKWLKPVSAVVISSLVAGLATAPIAAAHFNQIVHYGLLANVLSVPVMGIVVMPAAVVAMCLMPLGLEAIPLWIMGQGLTWILHVAEWVSGLDGVRRLVISPSGQVLPFIALGLLFAILWQGRTRVLGFVPVVIGFLIWAGSERPDVLIADTGALVGVMTTEGRALSKPRGAGFIAQNWLENDGDMAEQALAAARWEVHKIGGSSIRVVQGKREISELKGCDRDDFLVLNKMPPQDLPCRVIHPGNLKETGALAFYVKAGDVKEIAARQITGTRLWNALNR
ncbi:ComEC family competence protein [Roseovarius albus]|uniref:ComEC family competence protein n=1 Tax=Roseovarius albus TaxID=1247867 RepID=A0A1X6Z1N3_9RHOB|nr:ComEC/Rec2 family competence protein [Roseovarius albus]SLN37781.1 ComEC family competence protein [Roseovarius albus]